MNTPVAVIALVVLLVVVTLVVLVVLRSPRRGGDAISQEGRPIDSHSSDAPRERAAIIVNPTKFDDPDKVRERVTEVCRRHGWADPLWIETTKDDPGTGQARQALDAGVDMVCPLGGDGTVRAVAAALVDSPTPIGLLPGGTGNLLARNLGLPIDSIEQALGVAISGRTDAIDVGTINVVTPGDTQDDEKDYYFLVMAGLGFDASVMADAPEKLKARVGWPAYVVAGMKHLNGPRFGVDISFDDGPTQNRQIRTVVVGNVGRLQGGVELLPDANPDDGTLDVVVLSPKGVFGWASIAANILTGHRVGHARMEHRRCKSMTLRLAETQEVQLDGDPIGPGRYLKIGVKPACLKVRIA